MLAFQPHRYTRTRDCFEDFVKVIGQADAVLLTGCTPQARRRSSLPMALAGPCPCVAGRVEPVFVDNVADLPQAIADNARAGDVVMCMGAGSIGAVPGKVVEMLQNNELSAQGSVVTGFDSNFDVKSLGKVAVLMGGRLAEREVSLMSAAACCRRCVHAKRRCPCV